MTMCNVQYTLPRLQTLYQRVKTGIPTQSDSVDSTPNEHAYSRFNWILYSHNAYRSPRHARMLTSSRVIASLSPPSTSPGLTPTVSKPLSIRVSIIANSPSTLGAPLLVGANTLSSTASLAPASFSASRVMTRPLVNELGMRAGASAGTVEFTHCTTSAGPAAAALSGS